MYSFYFMSVTNKTINVVLIPVLCAVWRLMGVIVSPGDTAAGGSDVPNGSVLPLCFLFFIGGAAAALLR